MAGLINHSAAKMSVLKHRCGRAVCFVFVSMWIGYAFCLFVCVCVTYWLSIWSRWSSLPKVPWKPLRTERE